MIPVLALLALTLLMVTVVCLRRAGWAKAPEDSEVLKHDAWLKSPKGNLWLGILVGLIIAHNSWKLLYLHLSRYWQPGSAEFVLVYALILLLCPLFPVLWFYSVHRLTGWNFYRAYWLPLLTVAVIYSIWSGL